MDIGNDLQKAYEDGYQRGHFDGVDYSKLVVKKYLQDTLDEWFALGDRRFEPANMWGYNFIMKCFDDLDNWGD